MVKYEARLDAIFTALAHPIRRAILNRLCHGKATVGELAQPFKISLPAVTKHLKILERAQLIRRSSQAQWRLCQFQVSPLDLASAWITEQRKIWEARLDRLEQYLDQLDHQHKGTPKHD